MDLSERDLRYVYQLETARLAREECPTSDLLARVASREGSPADREIVMGHLSGCFDCAQEYQMAVSLRPVFADAAAKDTSVVVPTTVWRRFTSTRTLPLALAATVLIALGAAISTQLVWNNGGRRAGTERGGVGPTIAIEPTDRAQLALPPEELRWEPFGSATRYQVVLYDFESTPIWQSPSIAEPTVRIPEDVRARLAPGKPVFWRVTAHGETERRQSPLFEFLIVPR